MSNISFLFRNKIKIIRWPILLSIFVVTFFGVTESVQAAATRYMPDDCANLQACFQIMLVGDTLIIRDGTYTGSANQITTFQKPPVAGEGSSAWTTIKAEHYGAVFFGDPDINTAMLYVEFSNNSYWQFEGITWFGGTHLGDVSYVKFLRCGAGGNVVDVANVAFSNNVSDHLLYEDCHAWGGGRYSFGSYLGDHNVYRRCVARLDAKNTNHDGRLEPIGGFSIYGSSFCEVQNSIVIDSQNEEYWVYDSKPGAFTNPNGEGTDNYYRGCIGLKLDMSLHGQSNGYANTNRINCIGWDITDGTINGGVTHFNHSTLGSMDVGDNYAAISAYGATADAINSVFVNINIPSGGVLYNVSSDYNYFYNNNANYIGGSTPGAHDVTNINPTTNSLLYLPRIESNSDLSDKASDGGDVGATVMKKIGVSGTLWGETGYNITTEENLWPFPNEDMIKNNFASYSHPNIPGARGFATGTSIDGSPQTLTKYIWEYLGNEIPCEIYDTCGGDEIAPQSPINLQVL